jgi:hypothetical protein
MAHGDAAEFEAYRTEVERPLLGNILSQAVRAKVLLAGTCGGVVPSNVRALLNRAVP